MTHPASITSDGPSFVKPSDSFIAVVATIWKKLILHRNAPDAAVADFIRTECATCMGGGQKKASSKRYWQKAEFYVLPSSFHSYPAARGCRSLPRTKIDFLSSQLRWPVIEWITKALGTLPCLVFLHRLPRPNT